MTIITIQSSNGSVLVWPKRYSETETATVTFYQGIFALLLRVGFIFIQIGCIPTDNVYLLLMQNVLDIFVTLASFGLLGFMFAFGKESFWGVFGYGSWIASENALLNEGVRGFAAALTGTAIMTTLLASRLHYIAQVVITFIFAGFVQPVLLHSSSIYNGWMMENRLDFVDVSFKDTSMVLVTSVAGSTAGMIGCAFLRRRILRLRDIDPSSIGSTAPGTTVLGYFFILMGLAALALPSPVIEDMQSSVDFDVVLVINCIISVAVGSLAVIALHLTFYQSTITYWVALKFLQGGLASFVAISAAYDSYNVPMSMVVALIGAIWFFFISEFVFTTAIEDNCNIISIHFTCGVVSCLLPPLFSRRANLGFLENPSAYMNMIHLAWQLLCCIATVVFVAIVFSLVFLFLFVIGLLRNKSEILAHRMAKRVSKGGGKVAAEPKTLPDFVPRNVEHKAFDTVELKDLNKEDEQNIAFVIRQNFTETPFDTPRSGGPGHLKIKKAMEALQENDEKKTKLRKRLQKCKNIVVKNPLHNDNI